MEEKTSAVMAMLTSDVSCYNPCPGVGERVSIECVRECASSDGSGRDDLSVGSGLDPHTEAGGYIGSTIDDGGGSLRSTGRLRNYLGINSKLHEFPQYGRVLCRQ